MDEIDTKEWGDLDETEQSKHRLYRFYDNATINRPVTKPSDYAWALQISAGWLYDHDIGALQSRRNIDDDAWLVLSTI